MSREDPSTSLYVNVKLTDLIRALREIVYRGESKWLTEEDAVVLQELSQAVSRKVQGSK